jgi:RimJ/RimL family protein N-acetyltransferase
MKGDFFLKSVDQSNLEELNWVRSQIGLESKNLDHFAPNSGNNSWIIYSFIPSVPIGIITMVPFQGTEREIGFVLLPAHRGKGVLSSLLPDLVKSLGLELYAETGEKNNAAIRVLEKCGFQPTHAIHKYHGTPSGETVRTVAYRYRA